MRKIILAVTTMMGTIIGAGILGIPHVISKSGIVIGFVHILAIASLITITMLYLGEIALRTSQNHHLAGYAEKYLGKKGKLVMISALCFGIYSAISAYLLGIGESLSFLLYNNSANALFFSMAIWLLISLISYFGFKALESGEFISVSAISILIISMIFFFSNKLSLANLAINPNQDIFAYFAPFGVILFAFLGFTTIPEVKRILSGSKNKMKLSIIWAILICSIIYILFTIIVIGYKGSDVPQIATIALGKPFILLGILTMSGAYLALSTALADIFHFDFGQIKVKSWFFAISIPLILFIFLKLINLANFTKILSIGGIVSGSLTAILILLMSEKAKYLGDRKPEYSLPISKPIIWLLSLIFIAGSVLELINIFSI